ncbi:MAG TPA: class I SAM-dependent methyltransferase [Coleofasciculaceae cyanobacterium]|jgi:SAM-dependent methyltransferase
MSAFQRLGLDPSLIEVKHQYSDAQEQTQNTFAFKWSKRDTYESEAVKSEAKRWLFERYCDNKPEVLAQWLEGERKIILDAGCGSGFSALLFFADYLKNHDYLGVDISSAVDVARTRFQEIGYPGEFLQVSLLEIPIEDESIDIIFSEGVLHHTDNTEASINYLATKLRTGGRFLFYVYAKKAVIREFTDDYVREQLQKLSDEEAWEALKPLTKLGSELGKLNIEIDVPEDIPFLKIAKGKMDLQRFFYWNICKLFYRPDYSLEEMNHINFDWFRPLNCHRHTKEEIISYCENANLMIEQINVQESGITVVARKM